MDNPSVSEWSLTEEAFAKLLAHLDPDTERAGERYERLRLTLVKFFDWRGAHFPEECADETFNRVARKIESGEVVRDIATYCHGVARMIFLESTRHPEHTRVSLDALPSLGTASPVSEETNPQRDCFEQCLASLPEESRRLIIRAASPRPATAGDQSHAAAVREMAAGDHLLPQRTAAAREQAREKYQAALLLFRQAGDRHGEAAVFHRLGVTYQTAISTPKEAIDNFAQALTLYRELGDRAGQTAAHARLGSCYVRVGDFPQALEHLNQALALSRELNDPVREADALQSFGTAYYGMGDYRSALAAHKQVLQSRTTLGENLFEILNNIGVDYLALGEYQQALDYYQRSVNLARAAGNRETEALTVNNMGIIYRRLGDEQQALEAFQQALAYWRDMNNPSGQAQVLNNLGNVYRQTMDYPKALEHYTRALALFRQIGSRGGEATALNNLGYISYVQERYQEALEHYSQAHRLRKAGGDRHGEALSLNRLGEVWWRQGEPGKAMEALREALGIHRELNASYDAADVLLNLAAVERDQGKLTESLTTIEEALKLTESQRATLTSPDLRASFVAAEQEKYQFYIDLLMRLHQQKAGAGYDALAFQAAERARARVLLESLIEARLDLREGIDPVLLERERGMQKQIYDQSERLSRLLSRKADEPQLGPVRKELERLTTEYHKVEAEIRQSSPRYAALTQPRPLTASEIQQQLDDNTVLLEFALGEKHSWLWAVTRSSIDSYQLVPGNEIASAARKVYESLTARQPRKGETDEQYKSRTNNAEAKLQTESAMLSQLLLGQIAAKLQQEWKGKRLAIVATGALEYIPFAALPSPVVGGQWPVVSGQKITEQRTTDNGQREANNRPTTNDHRPLIADHEIVNLPSVSALATIRSETAGRKRAEKNLAIIADPVFEANDPRVFNALRKAANTTATIATVRSGNDGPTPSRSPASERPDSDLVRSLRSFNLINERGGFQRLPFSREEADAIASLTASNSLMKATDFQANRKIASSGELAHYRIVHFATHGLLNSEHPELSGLVLSLIDEAGKPQDGFLRMHEIYNLTLPADLVVLSACQTALGKEIKGEGLVGLTRGFMYAGAQRVVASLWQVDDLATAELMKRFYRGMLKDGLRPAQALRLAQLELLKQKRWSCPFFWAPFCIQGEWR